MQAEEDGSADANAEAMASEARTCGAIVMSLPLVISGIITATNPSYLDVMLHGGTGTHVLCGALALTCVGGGWMAWLGRRVRGQRRIDIDQRRARLGPRMTMPMVTCILPALCTILAAPAFLRNSILLPHTPPAMEQAAAGATVTRIEAFGGLSAEEWNVLRGRGRATFQEQQASPSTPSSVEETSTTP